MITIQQAGDVVLKSEFAIHPNAQEPINSLAIGAEHFIATNMAPQHFNDIMLHEYLENFPDNLDPMKVKKVTFQILDYLWPYIEIGNFHINGSRMPNDSWSLNLEDVKAKLDKWWGKRDIFSIPIDEMPWVKLNEKGKEFVKKFEKEQILRRQKNREEQKRKDKERKGKFFKNLIKIFRK